MTPWRAQRPDRRTRKLGQRIKDGRTHHPGSLARHSFIESARKTAPPRSWARPAREEARSEMRSGIRLAAGERSGTEEGSSGDPWERRTEEEERLHPPRSRTRGEPRATDEYSWPAGAGCSRAAKGSRTPAGAAGESRPGRQSSQQTARWWRRGAESWAMGTALGHWTPMYRSPPARPRHLHRGAAKAPRWQPFARAALAEGHRR